MLIIFQISFFVGIVFAILSFLLGNRLEAVIDGLKSEFFGDKVSLPLSSILIELFLISFGGTGWTLLAVRAALPFIVTFLIAAATGLVISFLANRLVLKPLGNAKNTGLLGAEDLVGLKATVSQTIKSGGFGEIEYVINGNSVISPARATNGGDIMEGKTVAICWIEDRIFYVAGSEDQGIKTGNESVK
jgi:membrane protein implicated in regulation of membrane protease activity